MDAIRKIRPCQALQREKVSFIIQRTDLSRREICPTGRLFFVISLQYFFFSLDSFGFF